ncbi:MAG: putative DNA modification/repair radical SAM protein [Verrucomicrobia bacterium]|nr:putative DNA modification/repair radical SAM protein [Verrucomicrobiota bacterium]
MELARKLAILADAAKYDASCASSGTVKRDSRHGKGIGSSTGMGICHSYTPDGRCVSLLKILLTNYCIFDCLYCINRASSNVQRARFTAKEVVQLTLDFYRRNYIEGLFLSSGIIRSPDYTMEQVVAVARTLRLEHEFRGYIHLKTIPEAAPELITEAGRYADRISINIELPSAADVAKLAPQKNFEKTQIAMNEIRNRIEEAKAARSENRKVPLFAPAGQSTQMIVGATAASDATILRQASSLYTKQRLRRVYYSAFSPIPDSSSKLPLVAPPLVREHRLYQADWLMRFYGFNVEEITTSAAPNLDLNIDPKLAWALRNRDIFPVDLNRSPRELLLRVPGLGTRSVERILQVRRWHRLRLDDLPRLHLPLNKVLPFVTTADYNAKALTIDGDEVLAQFRAADAQMELFAEGAASAIHGQF